ncbi:Uncharacterized protein FWK35_00034427 [Aphis craccivora]|uniref:Uncharacterized protein n=1 Tax=Aphis craccivora TaxID=307492 RepID=A0A6G0VXV7_APHCR|nr:Uncharacterized protein FWK35_00034427 [Aphis craccivora]
MNEINFKHANQERIPRLHDIREPTDKIKFVIVDFEFTMINRKDLLLVSGSMSNSLGKYKPVKLEGKPIVLTTTIKLKMLQNREVKKVMQSVGRIFRNKPELLLQLLWQLEASLKLKEGTTLDNNDNYFNLKLLEISGSTSKLLYSSRIVYQEKNGRMLNLMETRGVI